ncbi:hypothetical protein [Priestia megaterium]|uniref:hypothetical protein n=1 Tax=Priestia megaterium TaxID=1404 RepID=UPI002E1A3F87|nr:hypothetical protein [Priestia megaterium]
MVKPKTKSNSKLTPTGKEAIIELIAAIPTNLPYLEITKEQHLAINTYLTLSLHQGVAMKMAEFKKYSPELADHFVEFYEEARPYMKSRSLSEMLFSAEGDYAPNIVNLLAYVKNARARRIQESSDVEYEDASYYVREDEHGNIIHSLSITEATIRIKEKTTDYNEAYITLENNIPEGFIKTERLKDVANFFAYMNKYFSQYLEKNNENEEEEETIT